MFETRQTCVGEIKGMSGRAYMYLYSTCPFFLILPVSDRIESLVWLMSPPSTQRDSIRKRRKMKKGGGGSVQGSAGRRLLMMEVLGMTSSFLLLLVETPFRKKKEQEQTLFKLTKVARVPLISCHPPWINFVSRTTTTTTATRCVLRPVGFEKNHLIEEKPFSPPGATLVFCFPPCYCSHAGNILSILVLVTHDMDLKRTFLHILVTLISFDLACIVFNLLLFCLPHLSRDYFTDVFPYIVPTVLPMAQIALTGEQQVTLG